MTAPRNSLDIAKPPAATRVVAAMSGGVDSSVVAALLKREGYDVVGVTLQLYDHGAAVHRAGACCAGQDIHDARTAAAALGVPHYVLDYESRFREQVIEDFADAYLRGETPVPCIRCNQTVKFRDLVETARDLGAAAMAKAAATTLILVTNTVAGRQWKRELIARTSLTEEEIGEYSGERKEIRPVTIATYQVITRRTKGEYRHL